jgi:D-3-phosphoglycerate dehydrogenase / 2-oxoglutarate reductase
MAGEEDGQRPTLPIPMAPTTLLRAGGPPPPGVKAASPASTLYSFPKSKVKVLLLENVHPAAIDMFRAEEYQVESLPKALSEDELVARIAGVHLLGIRSKTRVSARVLAASSRLLAVGCFCIGTDQVDLAAAELAGVPVFNAPYGNTRSVAELVLAEIVALSRRLADQSKSLHAGEWTKSAAGCNEVRGKTLGIVGFGHIGSQLCIMAEAMGMQVLYHDVVSVLPIGRAQAVSTLDELLAASDFVSLHVPRSPTTKNLISTDQLAKMKKGAKLINASRGTVVDIEALAAALASGHLGGAAVDVFPSEPGKNGPGFESPLRGLPNVILTPHIGGSTAEAQLNIGREVAAALSNYVNLGSTTGAVNFPQLDMPFTPNSHRILNVHKNVPGVLRDINLIVSENDANVRAQLLGTSALVGYIIIDLDKATGASTKVSISKLDTSITTRILY